MSDDKPQILFVDDEPHVLKALGRSLRGKRHDWDMTFVDSGEAALSEIEVNSFDVVVTDLKMFGVSGMDVVKSLNDKSPNTRCIILTGTADLQIAADIINTLQIYRFYTKPCTTDMLVEGVTAALSDTLPSGGTDETSTRELGNDLGNVVLDRLSTGVLVTNRSSNVIYMNQTAAETIAADDGLSIGHEKVLRASTSADTNKLKEACQEIGDIEDENHVVALSIERPSMQEALKLILAPLNDASDEHEGRVIIFVSDASRKVFPSPEIIGNFFHLTPTESRLAWELVRGQRTEEMAEAMGITVSSARTYLKRVMEKTGTNRQVDLVMLLLNTPQIQTQPDKEETRE